jgi:hypothetical protein
MKKLILFCLLFSYTAVFGQTIAVSSGADMSSTTATPGMLRIHPNRSNGAITIKALFVKPFITRLLLRLVLKTLQRGL